MTKKASTPALRFKGFTYTWEQRKLGEAVQEVTRNDATSDAPIMMITANNGFIEQSERYAFNNAGESLKKYILLEKGELAYNHGASKLRPYGSCFTLTTSENARIPFVYHCFSADEQNSEFLSIELNGADVENQLRRIVSSGARMDGLLNISFQEYVSVSVLLPTIEEQNKIADFFKNLDNLITLHQRKYDKLTNMKKSMLEKMFPKNGANVPEIRFKGFTDAWEQRKVGEVSESYSGGTPSVGVKEYYGGQIPFIRSAEINSEITELFLTEEGLKNSSARLVAVGDILYALYGATSGEVGRARLKGAINQAILAIKPHTDYDSEYLAQWLRKSKHSIIETYLQGGQGNLSGTIVKELSVDFPSLKEQKAIGDFFRQLDNLITLHQRELEKLKNLKKACLEKMFV